MFKAALLTCITVLYGSGKRVAGLMAMTTLIVGLDSGKVNAEERQLVKVEEDWEVLITEADEGSSSPQIINVIAPGQSLAGAYAMIEFNHSTFPYFSEGGLQLQGRRGDLLISSKSFATGQTLRHDYDRLKYTIGLRQYDDNMLVIVKNVASKSWGGSLKNNVMLLAFPREHFSLTDYSPDFSATASSVHVGAHRVASMYMTKSRKFYSDDTVEEDETVRYSKRYLEIDGAIILDYYSSVLE